MISKNKIKLIKSLTQKKYRLKNNLFLAEGNKITREVLNSDFNIHTLICTNEFIDKTGKNLSNVDEIIVASQEEVKKASLLKNPQQAMALCKIPDWPFSFDKISKGLVLCLDGIQDPGNLGTILRIADWFGINAVCASPDTADIFNPKAIQASMGAFLRVKVYYLGLDGILKNALKNGIPVFGAFLKGENIYSKNLPSEALIVVGNEGQGISGELGKIIKNRICIPSCKANSPESLNVSAATAIICSEFRRRELKAIQNES